MSFTHTQALMGTYLVAALAGGAFAGDCIEIGDPAAGIQAGDEISVDTVWTNDNCYTLIDQIFVVDDATLTIEPGTVIASGTNGSLAITRGCKIIAKGTKDAPIIFTSLADVATWDADAGHPTGGDPTTGTWRPAANEWGNLTLMGDAYISNGSGQDHFLAGNTNSCGNNVSRMEGFVPDLENDPLIQYGGTDDDDNSGCLEYVSLRYAGLVVGVGSELNGLSMGGIGRNTSVHHVEIMNNVDDGIETWGGTVNYKHFSIWNIGDDSFDVDQGWRGKAQFGLIVQGYSLANSQGSGVGDNCFETDGAEDSDAQPVTTATIYNCTTIGQPLIGDHGAAFRDGARVQYRQCIFMNLGDRLIRNDHISDGGADGYGFNGTLGFPATWTTAFDSVPAHANDCANPALRYQAQSAGSAAIQQGFLSEMTDSVFFQNSASAYTDSGSVDPLGSNSLGVTVANGSAPAKANVVAATSPIKAITRGPAVGGGTAAATVLPVISLDPRANADAVASVATAPSDGFFSPVKYRGAFPPNKNWLTGWTAADAFGYSVPAPCTSDINGDGIVNVTDLLALLAAWGPCPDCPEDTDDNGVTNVTDLLALLAAWGPC